MHVYVRDSPRCIALVSSPDGDNRASLSSSSTSSSASTSRSSLNAAPSAESNNQAGCALLLSTAANTQGRSTGPARAVVELVGAQDVDLGSMQRITHRPTHGCLGLINVGQDLFVAVVTSALQVGSVRPGETVMRITSVSFYCINKSMWDDTLVSDPNDALDTHHSGLTTEPPAYQPSIYEHPCASLKKLLGTGTFYYAAQGSFDLSSRLERRAGSKGMQQHDISSYDSRFVWNTYLIDPLMDFRDRLEPPERARLDQQCFLVLAMQGFVGVYDVPASSSSSRATPHSTVALISRLSWKRAGTRFNTRGVDDDGNVANFVESETIFSSDEVSFSYTQTRGSIPLFWEQQGLQTFNQRIQITRPRIASQPAFDRHFADLISHYRHVHAINLLGTRDAETVLSAAYAEHMRASSAEGFSSPLEGGAKHDDEDLERIGLTNFDFHATSRIAGGIEGVRSELRYLGPVQLKKKAFGYTLVEPRGGSLVVRQEGVFRTNCLDCLDRTNVVEDILSQTTLESFIESWASGTPGLEAFSSPSHPIWTHHRVLWADNGDALSKIYAGTGALNTSFTRSGGKKTLGGSLGGLVSDAAKSMGRMYINNFQDKGKQTVIDVLLGNMANQRPVTIHDPLHDSVRADLIDRLDEYSSSKEVSIFAGTYNLNGRPPGESLLPWLFPPDSETEPDIFALGFQEIVQLTPQQILMTDPDKIRMWEGAIIDTLSRRPNKKSDYIILRSEQLVGTALILLVKANLVGSIRQVEAAAKKTGLKGMSGNKGGVAIRLNFFDTSFCFVTAHFAAGHSNFEERNADYWTISRGLTFQRGKTIGSHDHVLWLGDFNYRIDLSNEQARHLASRDDYASLYRADQLARSRDAGAVFPGYEEGPLLFRPTYKYDNGFNTYDSSEKQRIPAWTDRILYRGVTLDQLAYFRAELRTSDHRPVYALFRAQVRIVDHVKRGEISRELMNERKKTVGAAGLGIYGSSDESEIDDDLPDPSDERHNWWDEGEQSTDSSLDSEEDIASPANATATANANANPFSTSGTVSNTSRHGANAAANATSTSNPNSPSSNLTNSRFTSTSTSTSTPTPAAAPVLTPVPAPAATSSTITRRPPPPPARPRVLFPNGSSTSTNTNTATGPSTSASSSPPRPPSHSPPMERRVFSGPPAPGVGVGVAGGVGLGAMANSVSSSALSGALQKPPPPPIPTKPSTSTISNSSVNSNSNSSSTANAPCNSNVPSNASSNATSNPSRRPGFPRSASYSSVRSGKSLLEDSDSAEDEARSGKVMDL